MTLPKRIIIVGMLAFLLLFFTGSYVYFAINKSQSDFSMTTVEKTISAEDLKDRTLRGLMDSNVPDDWLWYRNLAWGGFFKYPSNWRLSDHFDYSNVRIINLEGDGYFISIRKYDENYFPIPEEIKNFATNPPYIISGHAAQTWQIDSGAEKGFWLVIKAGDFLFDIHTPDKTKEISDLILPTFYVFPENIIPDAIALNTPLATNLLPEIEEYWGPCKTDSSVVILDDNGFLEHGRVPYSSPLRSDVELNIEPFIRLAYEKIDADKNKLIIPLLGYKTNGYCIQYPNNWIAELAGVESLTVRFNKGSAELPEVFVQVLTSELTVENADQEVYRYELSSRPLIDSEESILSKTIEQIGKQDVLVVKSIQDNTYFTRYFLKHSDSLYMFKTSTELAKADNQEFKDLLSTIHEMIKSINFIPTISLRDPHQ